MTLCCRVEKICWIWNGTLGESRKEDERKRWLFKEGQSKRIYYDIS